MSTFTRNELRLTPELQEPFAQMLNAYRWHVFFTGTFKHARSINTAKRDTLKFLRYGLEKKLGLIIPAYLLWVNQESDIHLHGLLGSHRTKRIKKTLLGISDSQIEHAWRFGRAESQKLAGLSPRVTAPFSEHDDKRLEVCRYVCGKRNLGSDWPCEEEHRRSKLWDVIEKRPANKLLKQT